MPMAKVAIIADNRTIGVFAVLGFDAFRVKGPEEAARILDEVSKGEYALVYITEGLAMHLEDKLAFLRQKPLPAIGVIPGPEGAFGTGLMHLKATVEKAVGADILFKGEER